MVWLHGPPAAAVPAPQDYVLLSLVRTRIVGHLRDVRRLVVAMSRARLGLYVVGRQALFANCFELQPAFKWVKRKPPPLATLKNAGLPVLQTGPHKSQ